MTTRRTLTWTIPGTPEQILRRLADPGVARRRAAADPTLHAEIIELAADTPDGAALVMAVTAQIPPSWVPARVAAALPVRPSIERREVWRRLGDGTAAAQISVHLQGVPATSMAASATLRPAPARPSSKSSSSSTPDAPSPSTPEASSILSYEIQLEVGIPFAGGAIERTVIEQIARGYDQEAAVIRDS